MKFADLKKEMMRLKKIDKEKSTILMMLIDTIEKLAKEKNPKNPVPDNFIADGLKKYIKQTEDAIKNGVDAIFELSFLKELGEKILPKTMDETQLMHIITEFINDNPDANKGKIMGYLKKTYKDNIDMSIANQLVDKLLNPRD